MNPILILDGGMGRELHRRGAPFRQPEWSALALSEAPEIVRDTHSDFIRAGAEVITTNSYAVVPFHIGDERFARDGRALAERAAGLAREAASGSSEPVTVAGSELLARCVQHETDHLDGILYIDRVPAWRRWLLAPRLLHVRAGRRKDRA